MIKWLLLLLLPLSALAETYLYEEADGTRWITNQQMHGEQWTFIDKFGRPTASRSCRGMTAKKLEARAQRYMSLIRQYAREYRFDPLFIKAVIRTESCFDRRAVSRAGARGLMQLMPRTAESLGVSDSFNARMNIAAGVRYLDQMRQQFKTEQLMLAAYNAGPHNVKKYQGIPPFKETRQYIKKIDRFYRQYLRENIGLAAQ